VKIVEREREKSCDEMVLQFQYNSYEYASALLTLEKNNHQDRPLAVGIGGKRNDLLKRVELILGVNTRSPLSFNKIAGLLAGLIFVIGLNAILIINKPSGGKTTGSFTSLATPFSFFTNSVSEAAVQPVAEDFKPELNTKTRNEVVAKTEKMGADNNLDTPASEPGVFNVVYTPAKGLQLKKYEEAQVKAAMDASKKVLESEELKSLEINIADVFSQKEKEELKATYRKAMDKMDWNKWENKLRLAYDKVDWNRVNEQLTKAVNNIRIDSLQKVYTEAICKLDKVQQELKQNKLPGIPDTDITLKTIDEKKQQAEKTLNRLKSVRNKKIVHL
jgi:hypothetical protein